MGRVGRLAAAAFALASLGALAEDSQWYLHAENDAGWGTDRWYTSGVRIGRSRSVPASAAPYLTFLRPRSTVEQRTEWGVRQELFTNDPKRIGRDEPDRPIAGRLLGFVARHDYTADIHQTFEIAAGVRGPSALGKSSQSLLHDIVSARPVEWPRQLPDRVDLSFAWVRSKGWTLLGPAGRSTVVLHHGFIAGNILSLAHAGLEVRYGGNGPGAAAWTPLLRFASTPIVQGAARGWSGFLGASARYVAHNALLTPRFDDRPESRIKRGVVRLATGLTWSARWGVAGLAVVHDTREFEGQHSPHLFSSVSLHFDF